MLPGGRDKRAHTLAHHNQDIQNIPLGEYILPRPQSAAHDVAHDIRTEPG